MLSIQELRSSTKKELLLELAKMRKDAMKIRISVKTKHEKDTSKAKKTKYYIARILTTLREIEDEEAVKKDVAEAKPAKKNIK